MTVVRIGVGALSAAAVLLALTTGTVHLTLGVTGVAGWVRTGSLDSALAPAFVLVGLAIYAGLLIAIVSPSHRRSLATAGSVLMAALILGYIDWHVVQAVEGALRLGELGHQHDHSATTPAVVARGGASVTDLIAAMPAVAPFVLREFSVVGAAVLHAVEAPVELVAKAAEAALIAVLLVLRWVESHPDVDTVVWAPTRRDVTRGVLAAVPGALLIAAAVGGQTAMLVSGVSPFVVDVIELLGWVLVLVPLGWFLGGRSIVARSRGGAPREPSLTAHVPGMTDQGVGRNLAVLAWYVVIVIVVAMTLGGFVAADGHEHDHANEDLDRYVEALEDRGIDVDEPYTVIHHSEFHGGDALLLDYVTDDVGDDAAIADEMEVIVETYVDHVASGRFDGVVVAFVDVRSPGDELYLSWRVETAWVMGYLDGEKSWDELIDRVTTSYVYASERTA